MQSVGWALRRAGPSTSVLKLSHAVPPSRVVILNARRNASINPINWIREKLTPNLREEPSKKELESARKEQVAKGEGSVFESLVVKKEEAEAGEKEGPKIQWVDDSQLKPRNPDLKHKYSTANFKISPRKLNDLGRQISGKPIDYAILQMVFSEKRASKRIKSMLVVAKDHAKQKGLQEKRLIVAESWVTKGPKFIKRLEPRGRGHHGIRIHPDARLNVILKEGKTVAEHKQDDKRKILKRVVSAGLIREDVPLRNPSPAWAW